MEMGLGWESKAMEVETGSTGQGWKESPQSCWERSAFTRQPEKTPLLYASVFPLIMQGCVYRAVLSRGRRGWGAVGAASNSCPGC